MAIPRNITREHIINAFNYIDEHGTPKERRATKFVIIFNGKKYSPKYVISIANRFANGVEFSPNIFNGGRESNSFLTNLGFKIEGIEVDKKESHSWTIVTDDIAVKIMDKSSFLHNGTGIPQEIRRFFDVDDLDKGDKLGVTLIYKNFLFDAHIIFDKMKNPRSKLLWSKALSNAIRMDFPNEYFAFEIDEGLINTLTMKFVRHSKVKYEISIHRKLMNQVEIPHKDSTLSDLMANQDYVIGEESRYYILTIKTPVNNQLPYEEYEYVVIVLDRHREVARATITDKNIKKLLTPAKEEGIKMLLQYDSLANIEDTTMVHYKHNRPNGKPWQKDSVRVLKDLFNLYKIESVKLNTIKEDIEAEKAEEDSFYSDGSIHTYFGKRYERNPLNRKKAIEIHGTMCVACGFDFYESYGEHGKDFIEIHHVRPLSSVGEEVEINPKDDLVPLCANCHRMVHRKRNRVLSIDELISLLSSNKKMGEKNE